VNQRARVGPSNHGAFAITRPHERFHAPTAANPSSRSGPRHEALRLAEANRGASFCRFFALDHVASRRAAISTQPKTTTIATLRGLARAIEATWLAGAFLIPVTVMHENFMLGYVQMPKVFLLRSLALLLVALVSLEWVTCPRY